MHLKKNFTSLCLTLMCFMLISCSHSSRERRSTIPRETLQNVYVELMMKEGGSIPDSDSLREITPTASTERILAKYGLTRDQFLETAAEYSKDLVTWKEFYDDVIKQLEEMQRENQPKLHQDGS